MPVRYVCPQATVFRPELRQERRRLPHYDAWHQPMPRLQCCWLRCYKGNVRRVQPSRRRVHHGIHVHKRPRAASAAGAGARASAGANARAHRAPSHAVHGWPSIQQPPICDGGCVLPDRRYLPAANLQRSLSNCRTAFLPGLCCNNGDTAFSGSDLTQRLRKSLPGPLNPYPQGFCTQVYLLHSYSSRPQFIPICSLQSHENVASSLEPASRSQQPASQGGLAARKPHAGAQV
jgi:hypothetical protein